MQDGTAANLQVLRVKTKKGLQGRGGEGYGRVCNNEHEMKKFSAVI
jgi:hypothetical protein